MRRDLDGMWDRGAKNGPITGSGPNFEKAKRAFEQRQRELSKPGQWRCAPARWKKNNGNYVDQDWDFIDY